MNFKNIKLSPKSIGVIIFSALTALGLLGYWFIDILQTKSLSLPEGMMTPTLPPRELTAEEKARIQESINAPDGKKLFSEQETLKILNTLTAPTK